MSEKPGGPVPETGRLPLFRIVCFELSSVVMLALACTAISRMAGLSVLLGGLTTVIPGAFFALRFSQVLRNGQAIGTLLMAELGKLLLTASMFVLVFVMVEQLNYLLFFAAVAMFQLIHWFALYHFKET